jgi:dolichyl-diphosphooligosaccharide--protein glycosyltransferase
VLLLFAITSLNVGRFKATCYQAAAGHSHPMILFKHNGRIIDDYRDSYFFLRDKTPADARVMAWWDYGAFSERARERMRARE